MMQQMKLWTWQFKVMAGFLIAFSSTIAINLSFGDRCVDSVEAAVTNESGMSVLDEAAGLYAHRHGDSMKALFLTLRSDGTETLVSKDVSEDGIYSFSDNSMPAWRLNSGLSLFFQVPVYERDVSENAEIHARSPV